MAVVVGTAIVRRGRVLAQQRAYPVADAGRWELPGGRVEPGESEPDAVRRECAEELGVRVTPGARVGPVVALRDGLVLHLWTATLAAGEPRAVEHLGVAWLGAADLSTVDWLDTDRMLLPTVAGLLTPG